MNILPLLLQMFCGLVGGNIAGAASEKLNMGALGNSLVGLLGGAVGGQFYQYISQSSGASPSDITIFMTCVAGGSIGGAAAVAIIGGVKSFLRPG